MTRRSIKKSLYNNVLGQTISQKQAANKTDSGSADSTCEVVFFEVRQRVLVKLAAFALVASMLLQPVFANAQEVTAGDAVVVPEVTDSVAEVITQEIEQVGVVEEVETEEVEQDESDVFAENEADHVEEGTIDADQVNINEQEILPEDMTTTSTASIDDEIDTNLVTDVVAEENAATTTNQGGAASSTDEVGGSVAEVATSTIESSTSTSNTTASADGGGNSNESEDQTSDTIIDQTGTTSASSTGEVSEHDAGQAADDSGADANNEDHDQAEIVSSTTPATTTTQVVSVVQTTNEFSFTKSECTMVEDGSYYCQKGSGVPTQKDDLFAAPDAGGDLEIFLRRDGVDVQITENTVDDASPVYDPRSNTMVWHRLLNDRYQIVTYDVVSGVERVITNTAVNNMEPSRSGETTVWQRWIDNNWEIVMYDGVNEVQLTDSVEHDVAPNVRGNLVIWNVRASDGTHSLRTYDVQSGVYNDISDPDGVAVANPRMVVVYDAVYENGDTVMKGFDLVTGELIPLQQTPAELPDELPTPDPTGETPALITSASQPKSEQDDDVDFEPGTIGNDDPPEPDTLDLSSSTTSATTTAAVTPPELTLNLRATTTATSSSVFEMEDLVIPPPATTSTSTQM